jgi:hypothetical protein
MFKNDCEKAIPVPVINYLYNILYAQILNVYGRLQIFLKS